ncbi:MAG: TonB-dependent receptor [Tannerellaceae bacterium]|jgi:TonB-linked SusC/RagA family outer membrane protein|nr:TonB-dependent receptor [Tannerellaceae bacterium]
MKSIKQPLCKYVLLCSCLFLLNTFIKASEGAELFQQSEVTVSLKNTSLKKLFNQIELQTELVFVYNNADVNNQKKVSISVNRESVQEVLVKALEGTNLIYTVNDKYIILKKNQISHPVTLQSRSVRGKVLDAQGEPVIGANVSVKGTATGAITDLDGNFTLEVPEGGIITVSYIGYIPIELAMGQEDTIMVTLKEDTQRLDEVIIVGYSVQKKKDLTGAVSILKIDDLKNTPVSSVDQMMQGKLSGVNVMPDNMPGGGVAVRIRGFSTIRNNDPLYIIDGVPVEGGINFLNPNDIESMQVLKDASSASIYGARAANGVVIITTKRGKEGQFRVNIDAYAGIQQSARTLKMLDTRQYGDMLWQAMRNDGKTPSNDIYGSGQTPVIPQYLDKEKRIPSDNRDWVNEVLRPAVVQSYNVSFVKADKISNQLFSVGYFDQQGLVKYTDFKRLTSRFNSEYKLFDNHLRLGENMSLSHAWGATTQNNSALGGTLYDAYKFPSITPVYDLDGNFAGNPFSDIENPMGKLYRNKDNKEKTSRLVGNIYAEIIFVDGLNFKTAFGADYVNRYRRTFNAKFQEINVLKAISSMNNRNAWNFNWVFTNTLNYNRTIAGHSFNALAGIESLRNRYEYFSASRDGFASDDSNFHYLDAGDSGTQKNTGSATEYSMISYFGKLDYNFDNRYLVAFTFRRDGSSRLSKHKWGNFPAASLGWRISDESFFRSQTVSNLKVRIGWGQNGNSDIPSYSTIDSYASNPNHSNYPVDGSQSSVQTGFTQTRNGNADLKWETTTQTNIGLDVGFLSNELEVILDYFNKDTKDLLWQRPLAGMIGGTNQIVWDNIGRMNNKGIELEINYRKQVNRDWGFNASYNFSAISNKMTELNEDVTYIGVPGSQLHAVNFDQEVSRSAEGQPIGSFYVYTADGLFRSEAEVQNHTNGRGELLQPNAQAGDIRFKDVNKDGVIDGNDRDFVGDPLPGCTMGLTVGFNYRRFDVSAFLQGTFGSEVYDLTRYLGDFYNQSQYNKNSRILDAWTPANAGSDIPRVSMDDPNNNIRPSSYYIRDASFVRLKNFKIGYSLPPSLSSGLKLEKAYIYLQAQNLFTVTGYEGIDPEVGLQSYSSDSRNLDIGVDRGIYPLSQTFTLGINVSF